MGQVGVVESTHMVLTDTLKYRIFNIGWSVAAPAFQEAWSGRFTLCVRGKPARLRKSCQYFYSIQFCAFQKSCTGSMVDTLFLSNYHSVKSYLFRIFLLLKEKISRERAKFHK